MIGPPRKVGFWPEDVDYISFEGGGGKGVVCLGALAAFAQLGILKETSPDSGDYTALWSDPKDPAGIVGFSGSSSGAIVATLLASGHTTNDLFRFLTTGIINQFYDNATPILVPNVVPEPSNTTGCQTPRSRPSDNPTKLLAAICSNPVVVRLITQIINWLTKTKMIPEALGKALLRDPNQYIMNLIFDFGFFSGCTARDVIDKMISQKAIEKQLSVNISPVTERGITFGRFYEIFKKELVLTGSNIREMKSVYFSRKNCKDFKVADAVRIAMSFPFAFKPIKVPGSPNIPGVSPGVWIDGGLLNNNPIHAFDSGPHMPPVLGIRLGISEPYNVTNLFTFVGAIISSIMSMSKEGQIRSTEELDRTIELDTKGLSTLDFSPDAAILKSTITSAGMRVLETFEQKPGPIYFKIMNQWKMYP